MAPLHIQPHAGLGAAESGRSHCDVLSGVMPSEGHSTRINTTMTAMTSAAIAMVRVFMAPPGVVSQNPGLKFYPMPSAANARRARLSMVFTGHRAFGSTSRSIETGVEVPAPRPVRDWCTPSTRVLLHAGGLLAPSGVPRDATGTTASIRRLWACASVSGSPRSALDACPSHRLLGSLTLKTNL